MGKYKRREIEVSPMLLTKLLEYVKDTKVAAGDIVYIVDNLVDLSRCDDCLTLDEFDKIIKRPALTV